MAWYRALLEGSNLFLEQEGSKKRFGFYATRFVEASSKEEAERQAVERVRHEVELKAEIRREIAPEIRVDEIMEIEATSIPTVGGTGFTFFPAVDNA